MQSKFWIVSEAEPTFNYIIIITENYHYYCHHHYDIIWYYIIMVINIYYIPYIIYMLYMISGIDCILCHTVFLLWVPLVSCRIFRNQIKNTGLLIGILLKISTNIFLSKLSTFCNKIGRALVLESKFLSGQVLPL